uniref:Serpentine Receptor, class T n=1 Tax=Strongyloides papillosus TaxID=174720 RepID=A0A0N5B596_STREA
MLNPLFFPENYNYYICNKDELNYSVKLSIQKPDIMAYVFLIAGIIFIVIYIPCILVMLKNEFFNNSCYKIMVFLSLIDVSAVMVNSIATGIFGILRIPYCFSPKLHLAIGSFGVSIWCATCATTTILTFNRFLDTTYKSLYFKLFDGKKTFIWLILPIIYFLYFFFFTSPLAFSQIYMSWFFNPYQDYLELEKFKRSTNFNNIPHTINNFLIIIFMILGYGAMFFKLSRKSNKISTSSNTSHVLVKVQIQVSIICFFVFAAALLYVYMQFFPVIVKVQIQVSIICFFVFAAALLYVYMQFFPVPPILAIISQILWSFAQGCGGVIYITLNSTIRQAIRRDLLNKKKLLTITHYLSKKERNVTERRVTTKI